ncbi:MAG: hypothetical protein GY816_13150 [Cytophagales bacterium]|nr:hypothetical protein [Cytophagales bacterium]
MDNHSKRAFEKEIELSHHEDLMVIDLGAFRWVGSKFIVKLKIRRMSHDLSTRLGEYLTSEFEVPMSKVKGYYSFLFFSYARRHSGFLTILLPVVVLA